jgi:hypothetical protein
VPPSISSASPRSASSFNAVLGRRPDPYRPVVTSPAAHQPSTKRPRHSAVLALRTLLGAPTTPAKPRLRPRSRRREARSTPAT